MLSKLFFTSNAILPIVLTICVGYFLKRIKLFPKDFFPLLNKLSFRCCLPCLLFYNVYNVQNISEIANYWKIVLYVLISVLIFFAIGFVISILATRDSKQKGVLLQASYRSNYAIIGISLAMSLCANGDQTPIVIASILSSISIPLFNILATIALTIFIDVDKKASIFSTIVSILKKICKNPLVIGVFLGIIVLFIRFLIPENEEGIKLFTIKQNLPFIYKTIQMLATTASTIALIALGGNFEFNAISRLKYLIAIGSFTRLILCPLICLTIAYKLGFRELEFPALIALYGTPIAVSSVPMAAEMNNDSELAGQLVVWTSLLSAFTLFITIFICSNLGIFYV